MKFALVVDRPGCVSKLDESFRPWFHLAFGRSMQVLTRLWHRFTMRGFDRIPKGPCLFVGNHSAIGITDVLCLVGGWVAHFGLSRRAVGMMHKAFVEAPILGWVTRAFGAVYADRQSARQAFARGWDVACFPGGDLDSGRPFYQPRVVEFGPRRGYVKLALEAGVPIVPIATIGSSFTYLVMPGGDLLARVLLLKRLARCERLPVTLGLYLALIVDALAIAGVVPWWSAVLAALFVIVPNPVRVTSELLAPIDVCALTAHIEDPEARIEAAHQLVHGALQDAVRRMRHDTSLPTHVASVRETSREEPPASQAA